MTDKKLVILITGNPKYTNHPRWRAKAKKFYGAIDKLIEEMGCAVEHDPGESFTRPKDAFLWVAHSRGMNRLQYAPKDVRTLRIDDYLKSPHYDTVTGEPYEPHFEVTDVLETALRKAIDD